MPFLIVKNDITKMKVDAIVNAANSSLLGGGGVDGAIHAAAGPKLLEECRTLGGCETGEAKITGAYNLQAKYVIHTVGPIYEDGKHNEKELLTSCYLNSLLIAKEHNVESIAFPVISSGVYGYPMQNAIQDAKEAILSFLKDNEMEVFLVLYGDIEVRLNPNEGSMLAYYLEGKGRDRVRYKAYERDRRRLERERYNLEDKVCCMCMDMPSREIDLQRDESFSEMMFRIIDDKGLDDVDVYKKANISRKVFSKARAKDYQPSKTTAVALALALGLNMDDTQKFLFKAGYSLSESITFDLIIRYCIENNIYNVFDVNDLLLQYDQKLLGQ